MDRTEATGLGIAFAGHAALFTLLALGFAATKLPVPKSNPIEIEMITEEAALISTAPTPSAEAPAPLLAPEEGPPAPAAAPSVPEPMPVPRVEPTPAPPVTPTPQPPRPAPTPTPKAVQRPQPPRPAPTPVPKAVQRPQPPRPAPTPVPKAVQRPQPARPAPAQPKAKAAPARPAPAQAKAAPKAALKAAAAPQGQPKGSAARPTGRLNGLLAGLGANESPSRATSPPAQKAGPAVTASLGAEVRRQLKPHWKSPTGADAELLRTTVRVSLTRSGAIADIGAVSTSGQTASNRSQVKLHQEQAIRAVRLAAPFRLPADFYDAWKEIAPVFDRRLSQ